MEAASSSSSCEDDFVVGNENLLGVLLDRCDEEDEALLAAFNCSEEDNNWWDLGDEAEGNYLDQIADIQWGRSQRSTAALPTSGTMDDDPWPGGAWSTMTQQQQDKRWLSCVRMPPVCNATCM